MKIVFLHGLLGGPAMWSDVIAELDLENTHVMTLPGHGLAPWHAGPTFNDVVDAMADRLPGRGPHCIVGYSLGARISLALAARHPERIAKAILVGVHPGFSDEPSRVARMAFDDSLAERLELDGLPHFVDEWEKLPVFASQARLAPAIRERRRTERLAHDPFSLARVMRTLSLGRMPCHADLSVVGPDIHLVTGALDTKFTEVNRALVSTSRRATHQVVPNAGHDLALEAPQRLATHIASLLPVESIRRVDAHPTP